MRRLDKSMHGAIPTSAYIFLLAFQQISLICFSNVSSLSNFTPSIFLTKPKDIVVYYSLSGSHNAVLTKSYQKKLDICANMLPSNTFENTGRILTGL